MTSRIRQLVKQYGPLAAGVYGTLSTSTFIGCYYLVSTSDKQVLIAQFNEAKKRIGMEAKETEEESAVWKWVPEWISPQNRERLANGLLAMGMTKLFSPVKIGLTVMIVPWLSRKLKGK